MNWMLEPKTNITIVCVAQGASVRCDVFSNIGIFLPVFMR